MSALDIGLLCIVVMEVMIIGMLLVAFLIVDDRQSDNVDDHDPN